MATDISFVEFIVDQCRHAGAVRYKKMFGEYALYCDDRVVAFLCDNQFFLKPHPQLKAMLDSVNEAPPYPGAKNYYLLSDELDQPQQLVALIRQAATLFPATKPKVSKRANKSDSK
ncbi:TfoX/Sxy family protein [Undibacterium sp. LX40W]|uniref:TfoX/Sxy family protein n=1 Tax=Undibacterium nitidum TaxID=2762298 RepID=A0A923HWQ1_9BURK|nr:MULTISPECIES: TfoX/Sxy family protein [Undibacterium]MBC3882774.1 TfoX/Sxy family protein [Undibacterium nitidum]MBC3893043.1 TfoX/Sxy family protein [Undibacterium sp. LX40W]